MGQFYWWGGERETRHGQKWAVWSIYSLGGRVLMGRRHQQTTTAQSGSHNKVPPREWYGQDTALLLVQDGGWLLAATA
jgi:hypothetical protein